MKQNPIKNQTFPMAIPMKPNIFKGYRNRTEPKSNPIPMKMELFQWLSKSNGAEFETNPNETEHF